MILSVFLGTATGAFIAWFIGRYVNWLIDRALDKFFARFEAFMKSHGL